MIKFMYRKTKVSSIVDSNTNCGAPKPVIDVAGSKTGKNNQKCEKCEYNQQFFNLSYKSCVNSIIVSFNLLSRQKDTFCHHIFR